jgi:hypothetical protein
MGEFKGPIVKGAYYEREGRTDVAGPAAFDGEFWWMAGVVHSADGRALDGVSPRLTRRVYITHTDPAEVVAELRRLEDEANAFICDDDDYREDNAGEAYGRAADLVESMLGLARCGEDCNGNCELTAHGPTKAEAELAGLRSKAAAIVAELQRRSSEASMRSYSAGYPEASAHESALAQAYESAADLVTEKLGVKP